MDVAPAVAYHLMQETAGHYIGFHVDAASDRDAVRFAAEWHSTHRGQTVITRGERDGRVSIVANFEQ
jgi:hypothetical protein